MTSVGYVRLQSMPRCTRLSRLPLAPDASPGLEGLGRAVRRPADMARLVRHPRPHRPRDERAARERPQRGATSSSRGILRAARSLACHRDPVRAHVPGHDARPHAHRPHEAIPFVRGIRRHRPLISSLLFTFPIITLSMSSPPLSILSIKSRVSSEYCLVLDCNTQNDENEKLHGLSESGRYIPKLSAKSGLKINVGNHCLISCWQHLDALRFQRVGHPLASSI